jgi:hypothetical protein
MLYQFQISYVFIDVFMLMDTLCATINVCDVCLNAYTLFL